MQTIRRPCVMVTLSLVFLLQLAFLVIYVFPFQDKLKQALAIPGPNPQAEPEVRFDGKTVIVTGSGAGLGRAYAHMYSRLGANVVVNDVSEKNANAVVQEIKNGMEYLVSYVSQSNNSLFVAGGTAIAAIGSVEDGESIVKAAIDAFGTVHVLVANAGILRDKSFTAMSEQEWDAIIAVHLR